ncbi:CheR family methyltransferase [Marinilactibacillus piezotolerans]|uniref:CheR family methyltransferase n=1 Tax=Marinilactibacillus piezotolerans TaxID=258723 RepID=UPI0009AF52F3|nr:protein-glutamate O-methyltransferase CheR [Marinilactibacillus piezotolerans]
MIDMSTLNFEFFYKWVLDNLEINLNAYKEKQLQRRIGTVMKQAGAATLEEYARSISTDEIIKKQFLDYITINVTEFFRNKDLFENFELMVNTHLSVKFDALKIWSAACSIGAEPYSLAIIMEKNNIKLKQKILATDIDTTILERAGKGYFREGELKNVSLVDKETYFTKDDGYYTIHRSIRDKVQFKQHDLVQENYESGFHAIVCRNVTIYFKSEVKDEIYRKMADSLVKGGLLFTGATETIYQPDQYGLRKVASFIYEKIV